MSNRYPKLPPDFKAKWVAALRSGEYKQGSLALYDKELDEYCCLGVACDIQGAKSSSTSVIRGVNNTIIPEALQGMAADNRLVEKLVDMNDTHFKTFSEIADWIEENL